jgi:hypothetical protein
MNKGHYQKLSLALLSKSMWLTMMYTRYSPKHWKFISYSHSSGLSKKNGATAVQIVSKFEEADWRGNNDCAQGKVGVVCIKPVLL